MNLSTLPLPLLALALGLAGMVFGLIYFALLRRTVVVMAAGAGRGLPMAALLTLGRIAGVAVFLMLAAKLGATALLSAFIGFLLARAITMHAARSAG